MPDPPEDRATLVGVREAVMPEGETEEESDTVPENALRLVRLTVAVPADPD